jgi:hypothetical protein
MDVFTFVHLLAEQRERQLGPAKTHAADDAKDAAIRASFHLPVLCCIYRVRFGRLSRSTQSTASKARCHLDFTIDL